MMTPSQTHYLAMQALERDMAKLQDKINILQDEQRQLQLEHEFERKNYRETYREELFSRPRMWQEWQPRLKEPWTHLREQWQVWRNIQDQIHAVWRKQPRSYKMDQLLVKLSRFAQGMMGITNTQCWNARNPNPHLP